MSSSVLQKSPWLLPVAAIATGGLAGGALLTGGGLGFTLGGAAVGAAVGTGAQAILSGVAEGKSEQAIQDYDAALEKQRAGQIEAVTGIKQQRQAEEASRYASSMEAGAAAGGAVTTQGASLAMMAEQAFQSERENLMLGFEGVTEAAQARSQAEIYKMAGKAAKQRALYGGIGQAGQIGTTLLTGFA